MGTSRREFFARLFALLGGVAIWRSTGTAAGKNISSRKPLVSLLSTYYPQPTYLPKDFGSMSVYTDLPDGFEGGPTEVALFYRNRSHPPPFQYPLTVYMAVSPKREFMGTWTR